MKHKTCLWLLLLFPFVIGLNSGCGTAGKVRSPRDGGRNQPHTSPSWTKVGRHPAYPAVFYMTGIGTSAKTMQDADDRARQELAKQIQVHIQGVDEIVTSEIRKIKGDSSTIITYSDVISGVRVKVDMTLQGVSIGERWYEKERGEFYSLAVLNREVAAGRIKSRISESRQSIAGLYERGERYKTDHEYLPAIKSYLRAYNALQQILPLIRVHDVVRGEWKEQESGEAKKLSLSDIRSGVEEIVSNLKIIKLSGDKQKGRDNKPLAEQLTAKIVYEKGGAEFPVQDIPLLFSFQNGRGRVGKEKTTDTEGIVKTTVELVESTENRANTIALEFDINRIAGDIGKDITDNLLKDLRYKKALFTYTIPALFSPGSDEAQDQKRGIQTLVSLIINNIKDREKVGRLRVAVLDFIELTSQNRLKFSHIIESGLKTNLALIENVDIEVVDKEIDDVTLSPSKKAREMGVSFLLTGGYYIEREGIKINARLIDIKSGVIISAGEVVIKREYIPEMDFIIDGAPVVDPAYPAAINKLLSARPEGETFTIDIWTERKEYKIGEAVTFNFRSDRDCYLTLLDIGTSGKLTFLFPNRFHRNNFIRAGKTYSIPGDEYGFNIHVAGPPGLERIKAIATVRPVTLTEIDLSSGFFSLDSGDSKRTRDLSIGVDKLSNAGWAEDYHDIFIRAQKGVRYRGIRKLKTGPPEKPIDIIGTQGAIEEPGPPEKPIDIIGTTGAVDR